ncbi:family 43 glycosylhydrolase [Vallitalea pronyensis]|uniref:Family 43 glycosylhydrolase n=2 Tax=Vallitalea pronyensis TaxID=1348613 RepID=A0A8J8MN93_9FIRM|nr:family 43 glycosylhydrolase [Vallitalea pronyensis]
MDQPYKIYVCSFHTILLEVIMQKKESIATIRARERKYFERGPEWFCEFRYSKIKGLDQEENVNRRDPSAVLCVDGTYYTWYTKNTGPHAGFGTGDLDAKVWPWDYSEIWYASSKDGYTWKEEGRAVGRGEKGCYDDRSVFTPEILQHDGHFYLVYQAVQHPYLRRTKNTIGMAIAESPHGPWKKVDQPILKPTDTGEWLGEEDNHLSVKHKGEFDSHKVHDPVLFYYRDKYYLYYKGETMGEQLYMGGRETKWGVAIADNPTGPYVRSPYNPITNSGHETILWPYKEGMVAMLTTDGPEKNTIQYAEDGINFNIMSMIKNAPEAPGPFRSYSTTDPLCGIKWGLYHICHDGWNYIVRFDMDLWQREYYHERRSFNDK